MNIADQMVYVRALEKIDTVFRSNKIPYWLDAGTLLCAHRDGDLEHEHDTDLGVFYEDFDRITAVLPEITSGTDWTAGPTKPNWHGIIFSKDPYLHCDIIHWHKVGEYRTCYGVCNPFALHGRMLEAFTDIKIHKLSNHNFSAPRDTEEYISCYYGREDWKKQMSKEEYMKYQTDTNQGKIARYPVNEWNEACARYWMDMPGQVKLPWTKGR